MLRYSGGTTDPALAEEAAKVMARISGQFYRDFVGELEDARALLDPAHTMRKVAS